MGMAKRRRGNNVGWKYEAEGIGDQIVERLFGKEDGSKKGDGHVSQMPLSEILNRDDVRGTGVSAQPHKTAPVESNSRKIISRQIK